MERIRPRTVKLIRYPDWNGNLHRVNKMGFLSIDCRNPGRPVKSNKSDFTAKDICVLISLFIRETLPNHFVYNTKNLNPKCGCPGDLLAFTACCALGSRIGTKIPFIRTSTFLCCDYFTEAQMGHFHRGVQPDCC